MLRHKIYTLVARAEKNDYLSKLYDWYIMIVSLISVLPMMTREQIPWLTTVELITVYLLFLDYILRWITHDYARKSNSIWSFFLYPITPFALFDLFGILPSLGLLPQGFMILRLLRLVKIMRYSKSCHRIANVFRGQYKALLSVLMIAVVYIFISALIMFVHEPAENFASFYDALYWATTALTTVGYGDIYPCTDVGKLISMLSSFFGVAVIAMPAGIVTAGFMEELNKDLKNAEIKKEEKRHE